MPFAYIVNILLTHDPFSLGVLMPVETLGEWLRTERKKQDISVRELVRRVNTRHPELTLHTPMLSRWERNIGILPAIHALHIAEILQISLDDFCQQSEKSSHCCTDTAVLSE